ncbi:uncharacterized protein C8R40DRAFT_1237307 [Lentinula edodes]|uniref:uncharacterized protein n=1 Tax=Lentinula edodes TaxID=5353 RepID=UPI001E8D5010|nr:uncharacterized protein C8R40DRAFT_1237307 [Lentinula edodes]KAH7875112.1 hypothetical protein C8R40DRAFT_1237307 [Lentinula edodes]
MSTTMLRSALLQGSSSSTISQGMSIIRKLLATDQFRVNGLTTAEMYKLALKEAPPSNYEGHIIQDRVVTKIPYTKSGGKKIPPPDPPHLEHPIRSMRYLKTQILPILQGHKEIRKATGKRFHAVPEAKVDTGNAKTKTKAKGKGNSNSGIAGHSQSSASTPSAPIPYTVHLWMPTQKPKVIKDAVASPAMTVDLGAEVGVGADWDHLNKRRQRARGEKVKRDLGIASQVRKSERQERKRAVWEVLMLKEEQGKAGSSAAPKVTVDDVDANSKPPHPI